MTISRAGTQDASDVIALWQQCGLTRPWNDPVADFDRAMANACSDVLIMRGEAQLIGSVMVGHDGHRGWIYYLAIAVDRRGHGAGRALMGAAEQWLRDHGAPKVQLMVRDGNAEAEAFYAALGYGRQPVSTWGKWLDKD